MEEEQTLPLTNIGEKRARVSDSAPALSEEISTSRDQPTPSPTINPTNRTSTEPNISFLDRHGVIITLGGITAVAVGGAMAVDVVSSRFDRHYRNREQRLVDAADAPVDLHRREDVEAPPTITREDVEAPPTITREDVEAPPTFTRENAIRYAQENAPPPPPPVTVV